MLLFCVIELFSFAACGFFDEILDETEQIQLNMQEFKTHTGVPFHFDLVKSLQPTFEDLSIALDFGAKQKLFRAIDFILAFNAVDDEATLPTYEVLSILIASVLNTEDLEVWDY